VSEDASRRPAGSLDLKRFNEVLLESAGVGLALLEPESFRFVYHNRRFGEWFPAAAESSATLQEIFPAIDLDKLRGRLEAGRSFAAEAETTVGRRKFSIALQVTRTEDAALPYLVLESQNVTKIKELEYMIESYSQMIEKQNRTLQREKERAEKLILNIMPRKIYEDMKTFGVTTPQRFEAASVLMLDFVGFTEMAVEQDPGALIAELNDIFTAFDQIAEQFGCERIKTIGDAYMAVCGVPEVATDHAQAIAKIALLFVHYLERRNASHSRTWRCRIGINSGIVIGSIVGVQKYVYDIFGPGVNLAARMEMLSGPMEISLCDDMHRLLRSEFRFEERGEAEVKGFGRKRIFTLIGEERHEAPPGRYGS
jgi:adenylate cyclase